MIRSDPIRSDPIRSDPIRSDPIRSDPIRSDPIRSDPIRSDPIRSDPIRSDPIRSDPIRPDPIRFDWCLAATASSSHPIHRRRLVVGEVVRPAVITGAIADVAAGHSRCPVPGVHLAVTKDAVVEVEPSTLFVGVVVTRDGHVLLAGGRQSLKRRHAAPVVESGGDERRREHLDRPYGQEAAEHGQVDLVAAHAADDGEQFVEVHRRWSVSLAHWGGLWLGAGRRRSSAWTLLLDARGGYLNTEFVYIVISVRWVFICWCWTYSYTRTSELIWYTVSFLFV